VHGADGRQEMTTQPALVCSACRGVLKAAVAVRCPWTREARHAGRGDGAEAWQGGKGAGSRGYRCPEGKELGSERKRAAARMVGKPFVQQPLCIMDI